MDKNIKEILISEKQIGEAVQRLAETLNKTYGNEEVILVLVLKGSIVFCADLMRRLSFPVVLDVMKVSSYGNGCVSGGDIKISLDLSCDIAGKNVLIVEDIIDSGNTLYKLKSVLSERGPKTLRICTLLDKPARREADISAEYVGIEIPDKFIVGYGLDYAERFRQLPYIAVLD